MPGWYPDPSGQPGQFRHWDGAQWSAHTSPDPHAPAPGGSAPSGGGGGGAGRWIVLAVAVVALALIVVLVIRQIGGGGGSSATEDKNSSTPTVSSWDETSTPTPDPDDPDGKGGKAKSCPAGSSTNPGSISDGRLHGGGISVESLGWRPQRMSLAWVHNQAAEGKEIVPGKWFSVSAVGALRVADGFEAPKSSAQIMIQCFASSIYYQGMTGTKTVTSEAVTIDGHKGHHLRAEVYVSNQGPDIKGDTIDVLVLDTGNADGLAMYYSSATIGDTTTQAEVDRARASIKVD